MKFQISNLKFESGGGGGSEKRRTYPAFSYEISNLKFEI